ncbi:MAG: D-Ala-D-Ala carboxypeptidase family metallohydrolase [Pseudomonadota bacterium]
MRVALRRPLRRRGRASVGMAAALAALVMAGCNAGTNLPSQNVGTLLTPEETAADGVVRKQTSLAAAGDTDEGSLAPAVKNELVSDSEKPTSAAAAADRVSTPTPPKPATADVRVPSADVAKLKPQPEPKPKPKAAKAPAQEEAKVAAAAQPAKPKSSGGFFASLLSGNRTSQKPKAREQATTTSRSASRNTVSVTKSSRTQRVRRTTGHSDLPGVKLKKLFGIESEDVEELDKPIKVASVANLARRGTHGLLLQHKGVKVGCFPPQLVRILKRVERRFGRTPIVTSGYRSRRHNRRIRGARNSMHIYCKAADIQVKGVSKWQLAKYLRSIPGRGGVGTYCYTKSVHIDIGNKRDWNSRCRRKRRR